MLEKVSDITISCWPSNSAFFVGNKLEAFVFMPCFNVHDYTTIANFVVDIFPTHVASGINSNFFMIWRFDISLNIYMEELPPWILCLAYPSNLLHQPIHHIFLVKWSHFWVALPLNLSTKSINHRNININRKRTRRWKWRNWPLFLYNTDMSSGGVACIWDLRSEGSAATNTSINRSSPRIGCCRWNIYTFHDNLGVMCDVHTLFWVCVVESSSIRQLPVAILFSARMNQISDVFQPLTRTQLWWHKW